ncbi:MAG: uncharacterized protein PWP23_1883 [Candidatus Sumerlaeota bacterium]|nr:uncharacterized protein [Candidatus Sumerlaeota bacterium]
MKRTLLCLAALAWASQANADLLISQIMYNATCDSSNEWEWVELYNSGTVDIDLAGYVIDDNNSTQHTEANIAAGTVPAGGVAYLFNGEAISPAEFKQAWGNVNGVPVTDWADGMGLSNSSDTVGLWDSYANYSGDHETHANTIANVAYSDDSPWPSDDGMGAIYLTSLSADPSDGANWALATSADAGNTTATGGVISTSAATLSCAGGDWASMVVLTSGDPVDILTDSTLTIGPASPGSSVGATLSLLNNGVLSSFNITNVVLSGSDAALFSVGTYPGPIAPGASAPLTITFSPVAEGRFEANLAIESNDSNGDVLQVSLTGVAFSPVPLVISQLLYNPTYSGDDAWEWIEVHNTGTETVDLAGWVLDDSNSTSHSVANIASGTVEPGQTAYLVGDNVTVTEFREAWGDVNVIPVANWENLSLGNSGDEIALWKGFYAYEGDHETQLFAVDHVNYDAGDPWPESTSGVAIFVNNLAGDRDTPAVWSLASSDLAGTTTATGGVIRESNATFGLFPSGGGEWASIKELPSAAVDGWQLF